MTHEKKIMAMKKYSMPMENFMGREISMKSEEIRLNHSPPCWMQRHNFSHESEATRVKTSMASIMAESASEFWHRNLVDIPSFTNVFIEKMANDNLPVKVTLTRGYKFFHESYIHDVEGKLPAVSAY